MINPFPVINKLFMAPLKKPRRPPETNLFSFLELHQEYPPLVLSPNFEYISALVADLVPQRVPRACWMITNTVRRSAIKVCTLYPGQTGGHFTSCVPWVQGKTLKVVSTLYTCVKWMWWGSLRHSSISNGNIVRRNTKCPCAREAKANVPLNTTCFNNKATSPSVLQHILRRTCYWSAYFGFMLVRNCVFDVGNVFW